VNKKHNPSAIARPVGTYSHGVEVPAGARWLFISGQLGSAADGSVAADFREQADQAWRNLMAVLESAGMGIEDVVHLNHWLVDQGDFEAYAEVRARYLGDARPAATLMIVKDLVRPGYLIEVGAVAARVD